MFCLPGLDKLDSTQGAVADMQRQLEDLKPVLIQTTLDTDDMIQVVNEGKAEAEVIARDVGAAEAVATEKAAVSQTIKEECEGDLAKAMPMLHKALKALDTLDKSDIVEVKSMKSPPGGVRLVMQAVCMMLGVKPARVRDDASGKIVKQYWEPAKKHLLTDPRFLQRPVHVPSRRRLPFVRPVPAVISPLHPAVALT